MNDLKYVGRRLVLEDAVEKATGRTRYICDMNRYGMLHAKLLLSERPHADIRIDKTEALETEGIVKIFTHEDVPKVKYNSNRKWFKGFETPEDEYILNERARFVGDRLALVVGESMDAVNRALSRLKVEYTDLEAVVSIEEAKRDRVKIHGRSNLCFQKEYSCGNWEEALKQADYIVEDRGSTPRIHHAAMEPHICLAEIDDGGNLVVWTPCQFITLSQYTISHCLSIPLERIRVIKATMGGSFGGKSNSILEPVCAFASHTLKRPVKLWMDRQDAIVATRVRNPTEMRIRTAIRKDGRILGRSIEADINGGAYYTNATAIVTTIGKKAFRLYDIKNQVFRGRSYYTNTPIGGACRGYGSPQLQGLTEINIDNAAAKIKMDPCEFRLKNLVYPGMEDPLGAPSVGNARIRDCIELGMKEFRWHERRKNVRERNTPRYAFGVGMACGVHGNGYMGVYPEFTDVLVSMTKGGHAIFRVGLHEQGCGTLTSMRQIAAEVLDMPIERISVTEADTFITPYDAAGTQASRVTFVCGGAVKMAGERMKNELIDCYCRLTGSVREHVVTDDGFIRNTENGRSLSYGEVAALSERELLKTLDQHVHYEAPANPGSYSACFAEVKVDRFTGLVEITDLLAVQDVGKNINPTLVEGQIEGGAQFSLGMALYENLAVDEKGYVRSRNFSKYHIINAPIMPQVRVRTIEAHEPEGPFGAKSVGELASVAPAPAVLNAINFGLGTNITVYPATPERIVTAIRQLETERREG